MDKTVDAPILKVVTAWLAAIGVSSWSDVAAALAGLYTVLLIAELVWKKLRPRTRRTRYEDRCNTR